MIITTVIIKDNEGEERALYLPNMTADKVIAVIEDEWLKIYAERNNPIIGDDDGIGNKTN